MLDQQVLNMQAQGAPAACWRSDALHDQIAEPASLGDLLNVTASHMNFLLGAALQLLLPSRLLLLMLCLQLVKFPCHVPLQLLVRLCQCIHPLAKAKNGTFEVVPQLEQPLGHLFLRHELSSSSG